MPLQKKEMERIVREKERERRKTAGMHATHSDLKFI